MSNKEEGQKTERELTTAQEQTEAPQREKTPRASKGGGSPKGGGATKERKTSTKNGKPVRKTASGFTVVG